MKKIIIFSLIALLSASLVEAAASLSASWQLSTETLRPGGEATLSLTFTNTGTTEITNVFVTPTLGPYLKLTSGVNVLELGAIASAASQQASISFKADKDAVSITSFITLNIEYYTGTSYSTKTLSVPVKIRRLPILQIEDVIYENVEPGKETTLYFDVVNVGDGPAEDLKITLNQTDLLITSGSSGETVIKSLEASERANVEFPIIIDPEASAGINSIAVTLSYFDETKSNSYSETSKIGLKVTGEADFVFSVDASNNFYYGNIGEVEITISNKGSGSAEYVTVKTESEYGSKEFYIGSLDPDDSETIRLLQDLRSASSKYPITLEISYRDKFQNSYSEVKIVEAIPTNAPLNYTFLFIVLILIGAGIWYYRKRKK